MRHPDLYLPGMWLIPGFGKIESRTSDGMRSWLQDAGGCEHRCDVLTIDKALRNRAAVSCPSWGLHSLLTRQPGERGDIHHGEKAETPLFLFGDRWVIQAWPGVRGMPCAASPGPPFPYPPVFFRLLTCSQMLTKYNISLSQEHQNISRKRPVKFPSHFGLTRFEQQSHFIIL